ncbi:hypothetical protein C8F04DRAFT_1255017 [Mycena alexandri]|uniref:DUF3494 domain-containing protein n=1 Tax=Mycena alexandri TaxID=1745969 RepID=A0AAD6T4J8_9AGAR|nr:hypothetical protein C8F04DRAFT_1255017 [Mycena alexandri]
MSLSRRGKNMVEQTYKYPSTSVLSSASSSHSASRTHLTGHSYDFCLNSLLLASLRLGLRPLICALLLTTGYLTKAGVSNLPPSSISNPIAATGLTGFSLILDPSGQFATSTQVIGMITAASYATPTPATLTVAIGDMATAFADATGRLNPNFTNLASGRFQIISVAASRRMVLVGGVVPGNIVWAVTGAVSAAAGAHLEGVILGKTSISLMTGASPTAGSWPKPR